MRKEHSSFGTKEALPWVSSQFPRSVGFLFRFRLPSFRRSVGCSEVRRCRSPLLTRTLRFPYPFLALCSRSAPMWLLTSGALGKKLSTIFEIFFFLLRFSHRLGPIGQATVSTAHPCPIWRPRNDSMWRESRCGRPPPPCCHRQKQGVWQKFPKA